jgi:hypothetical protein
MARVRVRRTFVYDDNPLKPKRAGAYYELVSHEELPVTDEFVIELEENSVPAETLFSSDSFAPQDVTHFAGSHLNAFYSGENTIAGEIKEGQRQLSLFSKIVIGILFFLVTLLILSMITGSNERTAQIPAAVAPRITPSLPPEPLRLEPPIVEVQSPVQKWYPQPLPPRRPKIP